ncbi:DUF4861 family protein [Pedobacter rhodius]|uniref:DUF4861 family protein n=1 Tax=Pedobacter rhodius TaxID=3004098 RepID=A0ABT4KX31_9SPHI|nr:DUF4861 family protein [Pedobacter sp. SJ11]MCZ4223485.1 DUF4861 family protein [Pedobacter sp. SJ11]
MRFYFFILLSICWAPAFCQEKTFMLYNPAPVARMDELVILRKKDLINKINGLDDKKYVAIKDVNKQLQSLQFDDLDKDGSWDEVIFLHSFKAYEKAVFSISIRDEKPEKGLTRAHVRQRRKNADDTFGPNIPNDAIPAGQLNTNFSKVKLPPFLTEGPAWENDMVGCSYLP